MSYKQENFEEWIILIPVKMEYQVGKEDGFIL
jgi:hypothetical protein